MYHLSRTGRKGTWHPTTFMQLFPLLCVSHIMMLGVQQDRHQITVGPASLRETPLGPGAMPDWQLCHVATEGRLSG